MRMRHIVICGLSGCTIFFPIIPWKARFSGKVIEHKMCDLFLSQLLSETFLIIHEFSKILWSVYIVLKYPLFLSDFNETWIFWINLRKKSSNIKFHENSFSVSQALPCGRTYKWKDTHRNAKANNRFFKIFQTCLKIIILCIYHCRIQTISFVGNKCS
jgi:hypothetical protein